MGRATSTDRGDFPLRQQAFVKRRQAARSGRLVETKAARARIKPGRSSKPARAAPKQSEVDKILDKINQHGMHSLTEKEKRILNEASRK